MVALSVSKKILSRMTICLCSMSIFTLVGGPVSGQPSSSWKPLMVSGSFGHLSSLSGTPSLSLSGSGQPSSSWNAVHVLGLVRALVEAVGDRRRCRCRDRGSRPRPGSRPCPRARSGTCRSRRGCRRRRCRSWPAGSRRWAWAACDPRDRWGRRRASRRCRRCRCRDRGSRPHPGTDRSPRAGWGTCRPTSGMPSPSLSGSGQPSLS